MPATRHQYHFEDLSPEDFERLIYWLVKRDQKQKFDAVEWYGGARDKGRDVVAYKHTTGGREKWYIQCKRYQQIAYSTLHDELNKLAEHARDNPDFTPDVIVFATTCIVSPDAKDKATDHARKLGLPDPYYWGRLELDEMLEAQPETEKEFFGTLTEAELQKLIQDLRAGQIALATGERAVALGGETTDVIIVTGDNNVVQVFRGPNVADLRQALEDYDSASLTRQYLDALAGDFAYIDDHRIPFRAGIHHAGGGAVSTARV